MSISERALTIVRVGRGPNALHFTEPHGLGRLPEEVMQAGPARPLSERRA
jgi:hypothetical protein